MGCQLYFLLCIFRNAFRKNERTTTELLPPSQAVSVIVCFRNEAERLAKYLPLILNQDHPDFEVLAVDDHSSDGSAQVVSRLQESYPNLQLLRPPKPTRPGKKDALTFGIAAARHDILLLTDADCAPASNQWIKLMTAPFYFTNTNKASIQSKRIKNRESRIENRELRIDLVLGFSPYKEVASPVNAFQRFETTYTAFQYLGFARTGSPYMGVGRNIAYRKQFFRAAGGLERHAHLAGGDDDLLVSQNAEAKNTTVCVAPAAWTISDPATGFWDYLKRKYRHVGVGLAYPTGTALKIALLAISHLTVYGIALYSLLTSWYLLEVYSLFFLRWLVVANTYGWRNENSLIAANEQGEWQRWLAVPSILWHDFLLCFYYLLTALALLGGGKIKGGWE